MAGKGDMYRRVNRAKWEDAPIWDKIGKAKGKLRMVIVKTVTGSWAFESEKCHTSGFKTREKAFAAAEQWCKDNFFKDYTIEYR